MQEEQDTVSAVLVKYREVIAIEYVEYTSAFATLIKQIQMFGSHSDEIHERYLTVLYSLREKLRLYATQKEQNYDLFKDELLNVSKAIIYDNNLESILKRLEILKIDGILKITSYNLEQALDELFFGDDND
jgi:hypothetical protein